MVERLSQAQRRLNSLEGRLDINPNLRNQCSAFVDEFVSHDHMEVVPENEINEHVSDVYHLPHHCVLMSERNRFHRLLWRSRNR